MSTENNLRVEQSCFGSPADLSVTPTFIRRYLVIGACMVNFWSGTFERLTDGAPGDHLHFNSVPNDPPRPIGEYDFQIVSLPLRDVMPERIYMRADHNDLAYFKQVFEDCCERIDMFLHSMMRFNQRYGILSFVTNFWVPVANPSGRFMPRYDLRNSQHFVYCLNQKIERAVSEYKNCFLLDIDAISASLGRRYIQDDFVTVGSHGSILDHDGDGRRFDDRRINPPPLVLDVYERRMEDFLAALWADIRARYRTLNQTDVVKMVVIDLDDTLWQGVIGDTESAADLRTEGWPLGFIEALNFLKRRGVMLGIASKNDITTIRAAWPTIMRGRLELSDFAFCHIGWSPKADAIAEMIQVANILPTAVVFIDDNPVERVSVETALPGIRTLGHNPYILKRVLLWSSETQTASVTAESSHRTEMMIAQTEREKVKKSVSREDFLNSLDVVLNECVICSADSPNFARMLELTNKTNQFNTTGKRWTHQDIVAWLELGNNISCYSARDRFSEYGLIAVVFHTKDEISQFLMSCRVMGLSIENAIILSTIQRCRERGGLTISALLVETPKNMPCRHIYREAGFTQDDKGRLIFMCDGIDMPKHIKFVSA